MRRAAALLLGAILAAPAYAQDAASPDLTFESWWNGSGLTAPEAGPNRFLRDRGVVFSGHTFGAVFGILHSESGRASPWDGGAQFNLDLELERLLDVPELAGLVLTVEGRWREEDPAADPNAFVRGNSMFDPTNWASGTGWRLLVINASYTTSLGSAVADRLWLKLGWVQPRYEFALQPMSNRILNNAVNSAKGIGGNVPFSSSFSTWGGMARVRSEELYAKAGVFMAYPDATASDNHGVQFTGHPPRNSAMGMAEIGWTPSFAGTRLPSTARPWPHPEQLSTAASGRPLTGKYVLGGYLYDNANGLSTSGGSANYGLQAGMYLQADQLLYREPDAGGEPEKGEPQGLTTFSLLMLAPERNNQFQLYGHTGLNYTGPLPGRDRDALIAVAAYGNYSRSTHDETIFIEGGYHVALNRWIDLYPFLQYEVRPSGNASASNALILGLGTDVVF